MAIRLCFSILFSAICFLNFGDGARILVVCPTIPISHQLIPRGLALALNERGHELVVVTTDPLNDPNLKNYTEIDISFLYDEPMITNWINIRGTQHFHELIVGVAAIGNYQTNRILEHPEVQKLYEPESNERFDLILLEILILPAFLSLGYRFDAPIIEISSLELPLHVHYEFGNPILPSHPSHWQLKIEKFGSFVPWERLDRFMRAWHHIYYFRNDFLPKQQDIARKYFGNDIPNLIELQRNVSLIFVNQQLPISFARPNLPNIVEISGFHVSKRVKPLPKVGPHFMVRCTTVGIFEDLQRFLDEATQGFVYMSLGTNARSNEMSDEIRGEFVAAFSELPYKVIWKFEDDSLPDKPDNVMTMKWTPQEAILAHPNIKVFIYQGGLQSTEEAVTHAVPLIGLPVLGDQDMQVDKMVSIGVAKKLEITTIKKNDLVEAINAVATDSSYKQKMLDLQSLTKDRPYDLLQNAVWWTEHVIRHRGAPYLRSTFADEPWYQRQDMDIIAFLSAGSVIVLGLTLVIVYKILIITVRIFASQSSDEKMKIH